MKKWQPLQKKSSGILHSLQTNKHKLNCYATRRLIETYLSQTQIIEFHRTMRHSFRCYMLPLGKVNDITHTRNFWAFCLQNRISNLHSLTPPPTQPLTHSTAHNLPWAVQSHIWPRNPVIAKVYPPYSSQEPEMVAYKGHQCSSHLHNSSAAMNFNVVFTRPKAETKSETSQVHYKIVWFVAVCHFIPYVCVPGVPYWVKPYRGINNKVSLSKEHQAHRDGIKWHMATNRTIL
jgi:hypothetical protein